MLFLLICAAYLWCPSELMTAGKAFEKTFTFLHLKCWSPIVIDCLHFVPLQTLVSEGHRQVTCSWVLYLSYCHLCVLVNKQCQLWRLIKHRRVSVLGGFFLFVSKVDLWLCLKPDDAAFKAKCSNLSHCNRHAHGRAHCRPSAWIMTGVNVCMIITMQVIRVF